MDITAARRIHFVGIGGIGISALARLFISQGKSVSGSDMADSDLLRDLAARGAVISIGHAAAHLPARTDLVVYSDAVPAENPERAAAAADGIPQLSYFQALGAVTAGRETIAISGTHGKTTTTAMAGLVFAQAGKDPLVIVGSKVAVFDGNLRLGDGPCIVEADEYRAHMLELSPKTVLINNIEADHLDYYHGEQEIIAAFQTYIDRIPEDGLLIVNDDDPILSQRLRYGAYRVRRYGIGSVAADVAARDIELLEGVTRFTVLQGGKPIGACELAVPGEHNISNALGVITLGLEYGMNCASICASLKQYGGSWRRFETVGTMPDSGALVLSDYGHHPTEVLKTMSAAHAWFPGKKLILAFQPHQMDRTRKLFTEFVDALARVPAQVLIIGDIYEVPGREYAGEPVSSEDLVREVRRSVAEREREMDVHYGGDLETLARLVREYATPDAVVICMGAGTIDAAARTLVHG